jgi:hypothetical protein
MNIGIITQPLHGNYGGILQAYALTTVLNRMGHNAEIIEREHYNTRLVHTTRVALSTLFRNIINRQKNNLFPDFKKAHDLPIMCKYTYEFIHKYLHLRMVKNCSDINENDYDCYIVGSDQVWRPMYNGGKLMDSYLKFAHDWNVIRLSYAASFGTDDWEYSEEEEQVCRKLIKDFKAISVREESGLKLCKEHFGVEAKHVLDPTMLLEAEDYISLIHKKEELPSKMLVTYILNENSEKKKNIARIAKQLNLKVVRANSHYEDKSYPVTERIQPPIDSWLHKFSQADFIITDSFHACVISILFKKQFIAISNVDRGQARLFSLLKMFGIENHLITDFLNFGISNIRDIDYEKVYGILAVLKKDSYSFLLNALLK